MALYILQSGCQPLGQFDIKDADLANVKGGELGVFAGVTFGNVNDKSAADVSDGYVTTSGSDHERPYVALATSASAAGPCYLLDDGTLGYGTLFGQVIGTPAGLSTTGTNLGPHTAAASGKVTLWDKPGLYAVSVDNIDTTSGGFVTESGGSTIQTPTPGTLLYRKASGALLTLSANKASGSPAAVGSFIEMASNGSLVRTPARLVGAAPIVDRMVFSFFGATPNS